MNKHTLLKALYTVIVIFSFSSCSKEGEIIIEEETNSNSSSSLTITVGIFTENNGVYTHTGKELYFDSEKECQTWSRNAQGDNHSSGSHLHYNAAANVSLNSAHTSFSWTEYGPELDQTSIDATCATGANGVSKTVTTTSYTPDKNIYLKITKVE
ncbi:MAG: hypothetical protein JKY30_10310 [Flavobacteriales bacterium]|nr:hypothetical protein [Flavobacteriales bacterium]